jgi:choline/glycine/proline betaine transport protein
MGLRSTEKDSEQEKRTGLKKYFDVHGPVFWPSVVLITTMVVGTISPGKQSQRPFLFFMFFVVPQSILLILLCRIFGIVEEYP